MLLNDVEYRSILVFGVSGYYWVAGYDEITLYILYSNHGNMCSRLCSMREKIRDIQWKIVLMNAGMGHIFSYEVV